MEYAIIELAGKQHRVSVGDTITVDHQDPDTIEKDVLTVNSVLLVKDGQGVKIGTPLVTGAAVILEHVREQKGEKIRVFKYKSKSRYRRTNGHRQHESVFMVKSIAA